ncbi:MAG: choice-of-anchor B domain-containing protein [Crocinitomix sp.]|jgi:choice-of-anchor B domain-containing protein
MRFFATLLLLLITISGFSQLNMTQLGALDIPEVHETGLNDIWGYTDEDGNEYALVGAEDGVSVVDVTNPAAPVEISWIPGLNSVWRDLKTRGDYAYVTTEALQGLMIIDLSGLPGDTDLPVSLYNGPDDNPWESAHNLYQTDGYVYIFGAGRGNGGVIILDVDTDPMNPIEVGIFDPWYVHDGYVQNDTAYFAHIYEGLFSVVDLTDKTSPVLLGTAITPTNFAHNIWASEDGDYVFTTDEVADGFVGSFDVSDPASIKSLDKIQSSPGQDIVPHNSHVRGNYLYTSYYTDGVVIHDITNPHNLIEVANYDTSPLDSPTTDGCWGVYPFFASGNIIASDRQEGLLIYSVDEHQGSYLEGNITEFGTGIALNNVEVMIEGTLINDASDVFGDYATGVEWEGATDVSYFKVLYFPQTISIDFENGTVVEQDVILEKIPEFTISVQVLDAVTFAPIEGASVLLEHTYIDHEGITGADGEVEIPLYYQDNYQFYAGKWGHQTICFMDTMITDETTEIIVYIDQGISDDFTFDFGWFASGTAARGHWEREIPVGVSGGGGAIQNPYNDIGFDCGSYAFMTGNGTTVSNSEEVNDGEVLLISPVFDLTDFDDPYVNYSAWFFCKHGADPDDTLEVYLLNGLGDIILIDQHYNGGLPMSQWNPVSIQINPLITKTATMQMLLILSDYVETENVTEGGLDNFSVTNFSLISVDEEESIHQISLFPNPFDNTIHINGVEEGELTILDVTGRQITKMPIESTIALPEMDRGTYFFVISDANGNKLDVFTQIKN